MIDKDTIVESLGVCLNPGDTILVHSSIKSLGHVDGGAEVVVEALQDLVTASGTIVMPTGTPSFSKSKLFDPELTKSEMGLISEVFRELPDVIRSVVPMTSYAAWGLYRDEFVHSFNSYLDPTSPYAALLRRNGKIVLLGVDYNKCTLYHLSEEKAGVFYNVQMTFEGDLVTKDGKRNIQQTFFVGRSLDKKDDSRPLGRKFDATGKIHVATLGEATVRVFLANDFLKFCDEAIAENPEVFLIDKGY